MNALLQQIANEYRGVVIDAVKKANSGHLGLALGCAEFGAVLFGETLNYAPHNPRWLNRDRFILSAGHGSLFLYIFLHLSGFPITMEDIQNFRQLNSKTPGHPEFGHTVGVEASTGPLGQGIGNSVGMALSQKRAAAYFNTEKHQIFNASIVCLCGDGCLQEGVGQESVALAGHWGLDNLILCYDANQVTLDAQLSQSQSEDVQQKFEAMGWQVQVIDGHEIDAIETAYEIAKQREGEPHLIILKTIIGKGIPQIEGTSKAHGAAGIEFIQQAKRNWGLDPNSHFKCSEKVYQYFQKHRLQLEKNYRRWENDFQAWAQENPQKAQQLYKGVHLDEDFFLKLPEESKPQATRISAGKILNQIARKDPLWTSGSADLFDSVKNFIHEGGIFQKDNPLGRNIPYGIREHAMGAIMNGMAYDGLFPTCGSTFLSFADYLKPALRVAAMSHLETTYFFSHDSIALGEDGPTHQPIEQLASLQMIPNVYVFRPADYDETVACFHAKMKASGKPCIFILSRQDLPSLPLDCQSKRQGALKGAYIVLREQEVLQYLIIASGSEVALALETAQLLGKQTRVVSMPSRNLFLEQGQVYQEEILPSQCTRRIFIEAGCTHLARNFVGPQGITIGIDQFGASGTQAQLIEKFGFTPQSCYQRIISHSW